MWPWSARKKAFSTAIGGKVEPGESPLQSQVRQFQEETGAHTRWQDWPKFCILNGPGFQVHFFRSWSANLESLQAIEKEKIEIVPVPWPPGTMIIDNLSWLIPMAMDPHHVIATVTERRL